MRSPSSSESSLPAGGEQPQESRPGAGRPTATTLPDPTRRNPLWYWSQFLMRIVSAVWLRFRARGVEKIPPDGGGLVLINHQSFLDPLMVGLPLSRPISYLARDNLFRVPVVGWVLRNTYVMPINREAASTATIREALARMRHGFLVGIFPEGTRADEGTVGPFKPGFLALLRRGNVPVYPVGVSGTANAMPRGPLRFRPRQVCVVFGDPIPADEVKRMSKEMEDDALVADLRERVIACAQEATAWRLDLESGSRSSTLN